jgi:energy-coupling factor transporter ATP-binding protein EcfA2
MKLKGREILGKKVLILGEAGSGKTKLAARLLQELIALVDPEKITVIDLAPKSFSGVGGKLTDYVSVISEVKYLSPEKVYTPRLAGTSPKEVLHYAKLNRRVMEPLLNKYIQNPTEVLVMNDVTLYLHSGRLEKVLECVKLAKTFLATAYYGIKLSEDFGTGISSRERQLTDKLAARMDLVVKIG